MNLTFVSEFHQLSLTGNLVAAHTCRNMPTIIHMVALVRNMTGNCHVYIWRVCGLIFFLSPGLPLMLWFFWASRFLILFQPSRCEESLCKRTVWSAAVRMLKSARMIPQYQDVRTDHGFVLSSGRIFGHEPVEVRTPASKAAF
jgi:hypothetical protein